MPNRTARTALALLGLFAATAAFAADKLGPQATLTCTFPAAQAPQKVKPGKTNVSDGVLRINADTMSFKICDGCTWQYKDAKWKVTPTEYRMATQGGIDIVIARADGSAVMTIASQGDEHYHPAKVESRGQCKVADKAPGKP
jgi:zona occludens toxin (predicted ATPase)